MMMKKSWKKSAVSPVIATILMVAITVVLAAVLYVMVMGFGLSPSNNPTGGLGPATAGTAGVESFQIASVTSSTVSLSNCKVNMLVGSTAGGNTIYIATGVGNCLSQNALVMTIPGTSDYLWIKYTDVDANTYVSAGDIVTITCSTSNTGVTAANTIAFPSGNTYELVIEGPNAQLVSGTFIY